MKLIAEEACRIIATKIISQREFHAPDYALGTEKPLWFRASRIERRFQITGFTNLIVGHYMRAREEFMRQESAKHDRMFPDRLTYLHR